MRYLYISLFLSVFALNTNAQIITTVAGNGTAGYSGDGGLATNAEFKDPASITIDAFGNIYIDDWVNARVRKLSTSGIITTVAGSGTLGYSGDGGPATSAEISAAYITTSDAIGNLYIGDRYNNCVRKVNTLGIITTIAGTGAAGYSGDGGQATNAGLNQPFGVALDVTGNLYITESSNNRIRKVNTLGIITTIAGNGTQGFSGDGGQATDAELYNASGMVIDANNNLYIADEDNNRIRMINTLGIINTIAGNGTAGYGGDGGQATDAELYIPIGITLDGVGNIYIADGGNNRIRKINTSVIITTIIGNGIQGFSGDGGLAGVAELNGPWGLVFDNANNLFFSDQDNQRIRKVTNVGQAAGIQQLTGINNQVTIYPNPATNSLQVSYAGNTENTELKVLNMLGEVVMEPTTYHSQNFTVDVSQLATGVYVVELSNSSGKLVKRLIKE